jgi:hypothetical protein
MRRVAHAAVARLTRCPTMSRYRISVCPCGDGQSSALFGSTARETLISRRRPVGGLLRLDSASIPAGRTTPARSAVRTLWRASAPPRPDNRSIAGRPRTRPSALLARLFSCDASADLQHTGQRVDIGAGCRTWCPRLLRPGRPFQCEGAGDGREGGDFGDSAILMVFIGVSFSRSALAEWLV